MSLYTISNNDTQNAIADAVVIREMEIFSYNLNVTNYEIVLSTLPEGEWPEELVQYRNSTLDNVPDELDQQVSDYQYRDRLKSLLKTERLERSKSQKIYEALLSQLPTENREQLLLDAKIRINAAANPSV